MRYIRYACIAVFAIALITIALQNGFDPAALAELKTWLPTGRVDQKHRDAVDMLTQMAGLLPAAAGTGPAFDFQHTVMWEELKRACDGGKIS